jgi:hypothetical protein
MPHSRFGEFSHCILTNKRAGNEKGGAARRREQSPEPLLATEGALSDVGQDADGHGTSVVFVSEVSIAVGRKALAVLSSSREQHRQH